MFIISNDKWTLYFDGWRPRIVKTWISGVETALLRGTPEQQVEELKVRLRYAGVSNRVTKPVKERNDPKQKTVKLEGRTVKVYIDPKSKKVVSKYID